MRTHHLALASLLCLLVGLQGARADEDGQEPAFEVLVIGTIHAPWQFRSADFHPGHVRAALEAAKPDVIGVESNPTWFAQGKFHDVTYEAQGVAVPWAEAHGLPVYGVDWMDVASWDARIARDDERRAAHLLEMDRLGNVGAWAFGEVPPPALAQLRAWLADQASGFRTVNDIGSDGYGKRWLAGAAGATPFGGRRNHEIAARCVEVMKAHPGKRLVVVIGAGHKAVLDEIFRRTPGVRLLQWERDVPAPTEEAAHAALTWEDRVAILGHNLDGERWYLTPELIDMDRMRGLLDELSAEPRDHRVLVYFRARWYQQQGGRKAAQELLGRLARGEVAGPEGPAGLYPFPLDHWRMAYDLSQAVRLELARMRLLGQEHEAAVAELRALAAERTVPEGPRDAAWRMRFLARAFPRYLAGAHVRAPAGPTADAAGWTAADPAHGALPLEVDEASGALGIRLRHADGDGLPYLSRRFAAAPGPWTFTGRVRASGVTRVRVVAYVWPDGRRAERVAVQELTPREDGWVEVRLAPEVPAGQDAVLVNVYAGRSADGELWLDDPVWAKAQAPPR